MWRELMIPRALCVHAMPGHRRVTRVRRKFSFELQKLQLRALEPVRLQSADWFIKAARAITSRHAESQVQPTKRFPHRRNPLPHLRFVCARTDQLQRVLHVRAAVRAYLRHDRGYLESWSHWQFLFTTGHARRTEHHRSEKAAHLRHTTYVHSKIHGRSELRITALLA